MCDMSESKWSDVCVCEEVGEYVKSECEDVKSECEDVKSEGDGYLAVLLHVFTDGDSFLDQMVQVLG